MMAWQLLAASLAGAVLGMLIIGLLAGGRAAQRETKNADLKHLVDIQQTVIVTLVQQRETALRDRDLVKAALSVFKGSSPETVA